MSEFISKYTHSVDQKGRTSVPASIRAGIKKIARSTLVLSPGPDGCLDAYPLDEWKERMRRLRSIPDRKVGRHYKRMILADAAYCRIDTHNRILVPRELLDSVGITDTVLILGQDNHLELWNPDRYRSYLTARAVPIEDVLEVIDEQMSERERPWRKGQPQGEGFE